MTMSMNKLMIIPILCVIIVLVEGCDGVEDSVQGSNLEELINENRSEADADIENSSEEQSVEARKSKKGFDSATNEVYKFSQFTIEIPQYWTSENKKDDFIQRYAETGGKVAMLHIAAGEDEDPNYPVNFEAMLDDNENMITTIESTVFEKVTDYDVIDIGDVKGILYKGTIKGQNLSGIGFWFAFPSEEDRNWCEVIMTQTDNTEFDYEEDYNKMLQSIKKVGLDDSSSSNAENMGKNGESVGESSYEESEPVPEIHEAEVVLPDPSIKLSKDFESKSSSTVTYINVDGTSNVPKLKKWGKATVTDGVAEYLDSLKEQNFKVEIVSTDKQSPYDGYTTYTSSFKVFNSDISWTMDLFIEDEKYVEYELDIYLP